MKTYLECIPCFLRQTLEAVRMVTADPKLQEYVLREVLRLVSEMDLNQSPPYMGWQIHRLIRQVSGNPDPYREVKRRFNRFAMELYPQLKEKVDRSEDRFQTAVRLAIAGNIIDFGPAGAIDGERMDQTIDESLKSPIDEEAIEKLQVNVFNARDILYLTDNAGEIAFDRLLLEEMPLERITLVVKGSPVINDATIEDAENIGLSNLVKLVDNGSDVPGTILEQCSERFRRLFNRADLIIAKGQGNYETLSESNHRKIFFLLKVKCPVIARDIGCDPGTLAVFENSPSED